MKLFVQVFFAVLLATGITFGAAVWQLHNEAVQFERTMLLSVTAIKEAISSFSVFGPKKH